LGSNWNTNVFTLGLLNWGFDLCAELLPPFVPGTYLTNRVAFGVAAVVAFNAVSGRWEMNVNAIPTLGRHFPYGRAVEPP